VKGFELQGVTRDFARPTPHPVLRGIDLNVMPGELLSLVGPSGSGKTTLLRIIAGLDRSYGGKLVWSDGQRPTTAMVFQEPRLVPWLSILDNLRLVAGDSSRDEVSAALADVELADSEQAFPAQLSGGMQRRASLARALLTRPALLLLDEPFISLDTACAGRMRRLLATYWQRHGVTIVLVTHDLREAVELSTRIVALSPQEGRLIKDVPIPLPWPRADAAVSDVLSGLQPLANDWPQPTDVADSASKRSDAGIPQATYFNRARSRFRALSRSIA
jgi:ABC-type nitrate/sulfonate/bicarbonate transport system ATPase subunit